MPEKKKDKNNKTEKPNKGLMPWKKTIGTLMLTLLKKPKIVESSIY